MKWHWDPKFVRAWSALTDAYGAAPGDRVVSAAECRNKARPALAHALELVRSANPLRGARERDDDAADLPH